MGDECADRDSHPCAAWYTQDKHLQARRWPLMLAHVRRAHTFADTCARAQLAGEIQRRTWVAIDHARGKVDEHLHAKRQVATWPQF